MVDEMQAGRYSHRMFKTLLATILLALSLQTVAPAIANAQSSAPVYLKPIMVIRFNQPRVQFQKPLATMINEAVKVKPDIQFDLIQYLPAQGNEAAQQTYAANLQSVSAAFSANGVDSKKITTSQQVSGDVVTDEIYIYVR